MEGLQEQDHELHPHTDPYTEPYEWDEELHLPLWVPESEAAQIRARLPGWVEQFFALGE